MKIYTSVVYAMMAALFLSGSTIRAEDAEAAPTLERVKVIPLEGPAGKMNHLSVDDERGHVFIANKVNSTLDVVDVKAGKLLQQIPDQKGSSGLDYSPETKMVMIGSGGTGKCNFFRFDGKQYQLVKGVDVNGCGKVRYNPGNNCVYMQKKEGKLRFSSVIKADTFESVKDIELPENHSSIEMARKSPRLYLNGNGNRVLVIDTEKNEHIGSYPITLSRVNKSIILNEDDNRIFVGCRRPASIVVLDSVSGKEITSVEIGGDCDDISFDPKRKRIYASCGEGTIWVIQQVTADEYKLVEKIPTRKKARTGVFSAGMDLYFLCAQGTDEAARPELWVYKPQ